MVIGETILGAVLQVVFDRLASKQVRDFLKSSKLDQPLLNKLKRLMLVAQNMLADAEQKQITSFAVKSWLSELKHLFYRAEEIVDEIATEALRSSMELTPKPVSFRRKVRNLIPAFSSSSAFAKTVNSELSEVVTQLEDMVSQSSALNLREGSVSKSSGWRPTSFILDSQVFGREQEKEELLNFLLSEEGRINKLSVAAIVGMGGLGKTTLAKMVYNDDNLGSFDLKAWVYVSDEFDISRVTKSIIESFTRQSYCGSLELSVLQYEVSEIVKDKRFLLVLDDVWNEKDEEWECLQAPLTVGARGSKVVVTTRNDGVASTMRRAHIIHLTSLSDKDGWSLISKQAFGVENLSTNLRTKFLNVGTKIVRKCKGLPLAIKTIGGLLWCKEDIKEWEAILESSLWDLPDNKSNVVPALRLSYYHLPPHLKQCFSYCSIFPKGHRFDRNRLVLLWMAENFVQLDSSRRTEDIGEQYLRQLLSCSFFERTDSDDELLMHDLWHDLAEDISGEFFSRLETGKRKMVSQKARYFSFFWDFYDVSTKFDHLHAEKYTRTFYRLPRWESYIESRRWVHYHCYLSYKILIRVISQFHCLHVLCLTKYKVLMIPESIKNLKQLRFLDVSGSGIKELPESVCTLYHLQTLLMSECSDLERLPANMSGLQSLRHLDIRETSSLRQMPQQMSKLTSLQTLTDFVVSKQGGSSICELRELQQIRGRLALRGLENVSSPDDALYANLSHRVYVHELFLEFDDKDSVDSQKCQQVLENLKPPATMKKLNITKFLGNAFPSWLAGTHCSMYTNIVRMCLTGCACCNPLPPLGQLPSLRHLKIIGMDNITSVGAEFYAYDSGLSNPFPVLLSLVFKEMKSWEVWSGHEKEDSGRPFPYLEKLTLRNCAELKGELPLDLPSLKELYVEGCDRLPNSFLHPSSGISFHFSLLTYLKLHNLALLVSLPPEIETLSNLEFMSIYNCPSLVSLAKVRLPPTIKCLRLKECDILESLPETMSQLPRLRRFSAIRCPCLSSIDDNTLPTSIEKLEINSCEKWEFVLFDIPNTCAMQHHNSLVFIIIKNIGKALVSFPLGVFPKLKHLEFHNCSDLQAVYIPRGTDFINLTPLQLSTLKVFSCPKLKYIGKTEKRGVVDLPAPNLETLFINSCDILEPLTGDREGLPSMLDRLCIDICNKVISQSNARSLLVFSCLRVLILDRHLAECFPDKGTLPTSISILALGHFRKLKILNWEGLKSLTSIQQLSILGCRNLESLPEEGLPPSLGLLNIEKSPLLEERCKRDYGSDWPKIQHIPCVKINDIVI